jgi:hypothetical protein
MRATREPKDAVQIYLTMVKNRARGGFIGAGVVLLLAILICTSVGIAKAATAAGVASANSRLDAATINPDDGNFGRASDAVILAYNADGAAAGALFWVIVISAIFVAAALVIAMVLRASAIKARAVVALAENSIETAPLPI